MAIVVTNRYAQGKTVNASSYQTGAFTPNADALLIACFAGTHGSSVAPSIPALSDTSGLAWVQIADLIYNTTGVNRARITVFAAFVGSMPASTQITAVYSSALNGIRMLVFDATGTDVATSGVLGCFVQSVLSTPDSSGLNLALTLASAGDPDNRSLAFVDHSANETITPRARWDTIGTGSHDVPSFAASSQWSVDFFDTNISASWATSTSYGAMAFELKASTLTAYAVAYGAAHFAFTGKPVGLLIGHRLSVATGALAFAGVAESLRVRRTLTLAGSGSTSTAGPIGWYKLTAATSGGVDITGDEGLTNPVCAGYRYAGRALDWVTGNSGAALVYDWSFFDILHDQCFANGKTYGLSIAFGVTTPTLLYSAPFNVNTYELVDDNRYPGQSMPIPWDANWLSVLGQMITDLTNHIAARSGGLAVCKYIAMTGGGQANSFIVSSGTTDYANLNALAISAGYGTTTRGGRTYSQLYTAMTAVWAAIVPMYSNAFPGMAIFFTRNDLYEATATSNPTEGTIVQNNIINDWKALLPNTLSSLYNGQVPTCPPHTGVVTPVVGPGTCQAFESCAHMRGDYPGSGSYKLACSAYTGTPTLVQVCDDFCYSVTESDKPAAEVYVGDLSDPDLASTWAFHLARINAGLGGIPASNFACTFNDVTLTFGRKVAPSAVNYRFSTIPTFVRVARALSTVKASFGFIGAAVVFGIGLPVASANYAFGAPLVGTTFGLTVHVAATAFAYTTNGVGFNSSQFLDIDAGAFGYSASNVSLLVARSVAVAYARYGFTGDDGELVLSYVASLGRGDFAFGAQDVTLFKAVNSGVETVSYAYSAADVGFDLGIPLESASFPFAGNSVGLDYVPLSGQLPPLITNPLLFPPGTKLYTTVQGDRWDLISLRVYGMQRGSDHHEDLLIAANPGLQDYNEFPGGLYVVVPDLPVQTVIPLVPWKNASIVTGS
jgi:phage tail protein X